ncbi:hypothetical protein B0H16DRAFT_1477828 [Mycena metata]|uniref:Uncharacterized protein n=1 Tax=Mycena metata TaxID=1033252 RepID=A0AAD7H8X3_9AGAR|nr:hypothetical protein B0H16DRAFT_1477828 [Mycena metata]
MRIRAAGMVDSTLKYIQLEGVTVLILVRGLKCMNATQNEDLTAVQAKVNITTEFQNGNLRQSAVAQRGGISVGIIEAQQHAKTVTRALTLSSFLPPPSMNTETYSDAEDVPAPSPDEPGFTS